MSNRVFIIGAGALGLSAAIELARRGMNVTMADRGQAGGGSSWAGAGILSTLPPWAYPETVSQLALAGMRAWPEWAAMLVKEFGVSPELWTCGMEIQLKAGIETASAWCHAHHLAVEIRESSLWLPTISQVRNPRLLAAMREAIIAMGGEILADCTVKGFKTNKGFITTALTTKGEHDADIYIWSAGAWAGLPLAETAPVPNIRPMRGQMLLYPPGSHALDHIILHNGFYLVPRKDGHLLAGSTVEDAGFEAVTTTEALTALHQNACQILPSLKSHAPIKSWAGLRPGSPGNLPIIDRHPDFENLWVHTGHFRYGVTMAPASSRLLAELITGKTPFLDPAPYSWQAALKRNWQDSPAC
jgi:glycine oxidase